MRALLCGLVGCVLVCSLACGSSTPDPTPPAGGAGTPGSAGTGTGTGTAGSPSSAGTSSAAGQSSQGGSSGSASAGQSGGGSAHGGSAGVASAGASTAGSTGTGGASPCGAGGIFCTDFEEEALPAKLLFYPEYQRADQKVIALDTAVFRSGKRSLKVTGSGFSQMLGVAVPSKFWGRVYLRSDTDIQMGHNTYVAAGTGTGDPNDGTYIRIGEHQCQLELNRNTDDKELLSNGGQYMCSGGVKLVKDTWYCLEFLYDGPGKQTRVFVDNTEVNALRADWGPYEYKLFKLGFEKYHGAEKTLWYDDLAIAAEQVHCL